MELQYGKRTFSLDHARINIGRESDNDIVIEDDKVSGYHAAIIRDGVISVLIDQGSTNGTWVNGTRLVGRRPLQLWDCIELGSGRLEIVDSSKRRPTVVQNVTPAIMSSCANSERDEVVLVCCSTGSYPDRVTVSGSITIGRQAGCGLQLANGRVSGQHARLELSAGRAMLSDLNSTNGTFINGERLYGVRQIYHGDILRFDEVKFEFCAPAFAGASPRKKQIDTSSAGSASSSSLSPDTELRRQAVVEKAERLAAAHSGSSSVARTKRKSSGKHAGLGTRTLAFQGYTLDFLGRGLLAVVAAVMIIPAAWGLVPLLRWGCGQIRFSDGTRAEFVGQAVQIWSISATLMLAVLMQHMVSVNGLGLHLFFRFLIPLFFLPLTSLLALLLIRWFLRSICLSCATPLRFTGSYLPFLGWMTANFLAPLTIIGWAWVHVAFCRWCARNIEGGSNKVLFLAPGHEYLWRMVLVVLASILIIPIPFVILWFCRWFISQIEIEARV